MWAGIDPWATAVLGRALPWQPVLAPEHLAYGCHRHHLPGAIADVAARLQSLCPQVCRQVAVEGDWVNLYLSDAWAIAAWRSLPTDPVPERTAATSLTLPAYAHARNCSLWRLVGPLPKTYQLQRLRPLVGALLATAYRPIVPLGEHLAWQCLAARAAYPDLGLPVLDALTPACWVLQRVFGCLPSRL